MMIIGAILLAKEFNPPNTSKKMRYTAKRICLFNVLICGAFTNFIPILTVAQKWGLILTKMFDCSSSNYHNFYNYAYIFCLLIYLDPS